jgi:hypothetical protein
LQLITFYHKSYIFLNFFGLSIPQSVKHESGAEVHADGGAGAGPVRRAVPPANLLVGAAHRRPHRWPTGHRPPLNGAPLP